MNGRKRITLGRLWIAPEAREIFARFRAFAQQGDDLPIPATWPTDPATEIEIEPSKFVDGGLFVYFRGARYQIPPGKWKLDH